MPPTQVEAGAAGEAPAAGGAPTQPGVGGEGGLPPVEPPKCGPKAQLPLVLSTLYQPFVPGLKACLDRAPLAAGACFALGWTAPFSEPVQWRGFTQCFEDNAIEVRLKARSDLGTETVRFEVAPGYDTGPVKLTSDWATYTIDLTGLDYNRQAAGVEVPFAVFAGAGVNSSTRVYVDDVRWIRGTAACVPPLALPLPDKCPVPPEEPEPDPEAEDETFCHGGASSGGPPPPDPQRVLLEDFEDGDNQTLSVPQGRGTWVAFNDGTPHSVQYPLGCAFPTQEPGEREGSDWSFLTYGCGLKTWGAALEVAVRADTWGCDVPFDASEFDGIEFKARSGELPVPVVLELNTADTTPPVGDGHCELSCYLGYTKPLEVTDFWQTFRVPFAELEKGQLIDFDPATITTITWMVGPEAESGFELRIDDLVLYAD